MKYNKGYKTSKYNGNSQFYLVENKIFKDYGHNKAFSYFKKDNISFQNQLEELQLQKLIVSLLNENGGVIYLGICQKSKIIIGFDIAQVQIQSFKVKIQKYFDEIQPNLQVKNNKLLYAQFIPVRSGQQQYKYLKQQQGRSINVKYVIKINVLAGCSSKVYFITKKGYILINNRKQQKYFSLSYKFKDFQQLTIQQLNGKELINYVYQKSRKCHTITKRLQILNKKKQQSSSEFSFFKFQQSCRDTYKQLNKLKLQDQIKTDLQQEHQIFISNIRQSCKDSLLNIINNSISSKIQRKAEIKHNLIKITFHTILNKQRFSQSILKYHNLKLLKKFSIDGNIKLYFNQNQLFRQFKNSNFEWKSQVPYYLKFSQVSPLYFKSILNYLDRSILPRINKKIIRVQQNVYAYFQNKYLRAQFQNKCKLSHNIQMLNYFSENNYILIQPGYYKFQNQFQIQQRYSQIQKKESKAKCYDEVLSVTQKNLKLAYRSSENNNISEIQIQQEVAKIQIQENFKRIEQRLKFEQETRIEQKVKLQQQTQNIRLILVISNIQQNSFVNLMKYVQNNITSHLTNISISQGKHHICLEFNASDQLTRFWTICESEPHQSQMRLINSMIVQNEMKVGAKELRVGIPTNRIVIKSFDQSKSKQLKKKISEIILQQCQLLNLNVSKMKLQINQGAIDLQFKEHDQNALKYALIYYQVVSSRLDQRDIVLQYSKSADQPLKIELEYLQI